MAAKLHAARAATPRQQFEVAVAEVAIAVAGGAFFGLRKVDFWAAVADAMGITGAAARQRAQYFGITEQAVLPVRRMDPCSACGLPRLQRMTWHTQAFGLCRLCAREGRKGYGEEERVVKRLPYWPPAKAKLVRLRLERQLADPAPVQVGDHVRIWWRKPGHAEYRVAAVVGVDAKDPDVLTVRVVGRRDLLAVSLKRDVDLVLRQTAPAAPADEVGP